MTTWMVVEDEPGLYDMVLAMYDTMGVNGVAFADGEEAMEWIEAVENGFFQEEIPELALIDIRLPGDVNGVSIAERMRGSRVLNNTAIALMTAYRMSPQDENEAMQISGADELFYKPLPDFHAFEKALRHMIQARKRR